MMPPYIEARDALVRLSHQFLIKVLPFRAPHSRAALADFISAIEPLALADAELDTVLLRLLAVLSRRTDRFPTLVERYLSDALSHLASLPRFSRCVDDVLRYHCIRDGSVQDAIQQIEARYAHSDCTPQRIATALQLHLSALDVAFGRETGCTLTNYIRATRLDQAAILLATTGKTVKEVWSEVGYNHHSNFDHDFKRRFACTPKQYRARCIRPAAREFFAGRRPVPRGNERLASTGAPAVLIVDDDSLSCAIVGDALRDNGWRVFDAGSCEHGIAQARCVAPVLVFVGYRLEDMDGVEFVRRLRQQPNGGAFAVVLFTTDWDLTTDRERVRDSRAIAVSKLIALDEICELARSESVAALTATQHGRATPAAANTTRGGVARTAADGAVPPHHCNTMGAAARALAG